MPQQELQNENIVTAHDVCCIEGKLEDDSKNLADQCDVHLNRDYETQDRNHAPITPRRTAALDAMTLHELLTGQLDCRSVAEVIDAILATPTVCMQTNGISHGRPSTADEAEKVQPASDDHENRANDKHIAAILCPRTNVERLDIARAYKSLYDEDLTAMLKQKLIGEFRQLIQALMETPTSFDAHQLHQAVNSHSMLTGLCTKSSTLIEILCTRSSDEIRLIEKEYRQMFGTYLENDISKVTWHHLMHLFMWLCAGVREESTSIDHQKAHEDAKLLCAADEAHFARDSTLFAFILSTQGVAQLRAVFNEYQHIAGVDIEKVVEREFIGDFREALTTIIMTVQNRLPTFYAHRIHKALHGISSHNSSLIRLIVTRSDIDIAAIRNEYERIYHETLEQDITAYCSGVFREGLQLVARC
uniref:Annexin n=1 Tax=Plectus sambesii TaxID=2011161 RepID=A0A914WKT3_9BILA